MGVGIIGVSSGAAEALPFGAATLLTSGFVNGSTFDYTATVNPGRYVIEGSTADGDSPVIAYAPNSNTTAIAYPGKSAILNVTQTESVIRLSAIPLVGVVPSAGHWHNNGTSWYRNIASAENTAGTTLVESVLYYTGSTWYNEIWTSTNSGTTWANSFSNANGSNDPRPIEFIPDNGGYFLMGQNNNVWRSVSGNSWSQISNVSAVHDFLNMGGGVVLMATGSGIFRSTDNGLSWSQVYSQSSIISLSRLSSGEVVGFNSGNFVSSGDGINYTRYSMNYNNVQNIAFQPYFGSAALKNHVVIGNYVWPGSSTTGGGFTLLDRGGIPVTTTFQGIPVYRQSTDIAGPEYPYVVKMYENRGFLLAIGMQSGTLYLSTDGISWTEVGVVAGVPNTTSGNFTIQPPKLQSGRLILSTNMTGGPAKYTNRFAYKIFASAI